MKAKMLPYFLLALAVVLSDVALARDLAPRSRTGVSRSAPSMKVPRSRPAARNVPIYPGVISPGPDRSTIGLEYNRHLRERPTSIPPYMPIQ
jgi:hypothetical protein